LVSDNESYIKTLELVLNINRKNEKRQSVSFFADKVKTTFKSLSLSMPEGLLSAINKEDRFNANNDNFTISFTVEKANIDVYILRIETK
jgi:hypothetical protein